MEPKVFQNMNTDIATKIAEGVRENKIEPPKGAARAQLSEQLISFFPTMRHNNAAFGDRCPRPCLL
jgi:predicted Holliday junction resolvase-like endonuclease